MKTAEDYEKALQGYLSILPVLKISLFKYCKEHKVNYHGLCYWMRKNSIPVPKPNQQDTSCIPLPSFAPVTILAPQSAGRLPSCPSLFRPAHNTAAGILQGVEISLPNGVHVSIREISRKDMSGLIAKLHPR
jgi:hypothetical protein